MATTLRASAATAYYAGNVNTSIPLAGYYSGGNRVMRYTFSTSSTSGSKFSVYITGVSMYTSTQPSLRFLLTTDGTSYTNAGSSTTTYDGTLTRETKGSGESGEYRYVSSEISKAILPNTTYYLWIFPANTNAYAAYMPYSGLQYQTNLATIIVDGTAGAVYIDTSTGSSSATTAEHTWNISDAYYNDSYKTTWLNTSVNSNILPSGQSSDTDYLYSSYFTFSTSGLTLSSSGDIVVKITTGSASVVPYATMAVLTTTALTPNQIYPSQVTSSAGMSTTLTNAAIATARAKTSTGANAISPVAAGTEIFYTFEVDQIQANTTYYVYFLRASDYSSYSSWGWFTAKDCTLGTGVLTVTFNVENVVASTFEAYQCYVDNGTSWDLYIPYIDNGTSWDVYS